MSAKTEKMPPAAPRDTRLAPMSQREVRQGRMAAAGVLIIGAFMLLSLIFFFRGDNHPFSPVKIFGMAVPLILYLTIPLSAISGGWCIGKLPPAAGALWLFMPFCYADVLFGEDWSAGRAALTAVFGLLTALAIVFASVSAVMLTASCRNRYRESSQPVTLVVLGCRLVGNRPGRVLRRRLDTALRWLAEHPDCPCIVTGGRINPGEPAEADVMREYLLAHGVAAERITAENASTTTYENFRFSRELAAQNGLPEHFAVCTDRFHQYRVGAICRDNGIAYSAVNVRTPLPLLAQNWSREVLAILEKWVKKL